MQTKVAIEAVTRGEMTVRTRHEEDSLAPAALRALGVLRARQGGVRRDVGRGSGKERPVGRVRRGALCMAAYSMAAFTSLRYTQKSCASSWWSHMRHA